MEQKDKDIIKKNYSDLTSAIKPQIQGVTKVLLLKGILIERMYEEIIEAHKTPTERAEALLDCIPRRGPRAFNELYNSVLKFELYDAANILKPDIDHWRIPEEVNSLQPVDASFLKNEPAKNMPQKKKNDADGAKNKPTTKDDDDVSMFTVDNICIFCGERNESFTEEGLDFHYWKNCPMLKRCTNCKQVVEIATFTDHVLTECEAKSNFSKCPQCTEAIPKPEYDQHVADKACNPSKSGLKHCPLCHENISSGEDGWKDHLMDQTGCKQNPRRLLALNKPTGGAAGFNEFSTPRGRGGKAGCCSWT